MRKSTRVLSVLLALVVLVLATSVAFAQDDPVVLRVEGGSTDVPTLDPALATDSQSIQILNETYVGLTHLDEETQIAMPGVAESWEITENDDGTVTYTFTLRDDVPWVRYNAETGAVEEVVDENGDVRYVNAFDFAYGWERTLDPRTAGEYAYVLAPQVTGGSDFNTQEVGEDGALTLAADTVGFEAVDETTFVVTAPSFAPYQIAIYGMWMARPQPQWVIEEFGELWIEPENFVAYGPFTVKEWAHDEFITIIKNPFWPGNEVAPVSSIDEVQFVFLDSTTALAEYEAGNLDYIDDVDSASIPRIKADEVLSAEYVEGTQQASYYYGFSTGIEPFDDVNCRRAFSFAVDRQLIVDDVTQSGQVPAPYFSTPSLGATAPSPEMMEEMGYGIGFDPDAAIEELDICLENKGLADVSELPPITLLYNTSEGHRRIAEAIRDMWSDILGVEVQLINQDFAVYLDQRSTFPVWRAGWGSDYPDAHNFLFDVFHSTSNNNDTGWTNEEFDALLEEATTLTDPAERQALYAEAEQILVFEDVAIIPIYWYSDPELTKPYVERTYSVGGDQRFENWSVNR